MPRGISIQEAAQRLENAGFNFADRYQKGTQGKGGDWFEGASNAQPNWEAGVSRAAAEDRFSKGVRAAGANAYDEGIRIKGVANWPTGMGTAGTKYIRKTQPYQLLWDAALPTPRGAKRSPANVKRMQENVERFQRTKDSN